MLDPRARPPCPGCGGGRLAPVGTSGPAAIWSCRACLGVFAGLEAVAQAGHTHGFGHHILQVGKAAPRCRGCRAILAPGGACSKCASQLIACAACAAAMERVTVEALTIDVCRSCRAVWLDAGELGALVAIRRQKGASGVPPIAARGTSRSWLDVSNLDPLSLLPDGAAALEGIGSAAGTVVELLAGLFDGL